MSSRALVLQGGGPLGAYEAGAYRTLYDMLSKRIRDQENIFDIIVGTSIGAINATIIVSHVVKNRRQHPQWNLLKCWEGSADILEQFWTKRISSQPYLNANYNYRNYWSDREGWRRIYPKIATNEAARRYYSVQEFLFRGAENVFEPQKPFPIRDDKFFDDRYNTWYRYSNDPLKESVKAYADFPIQTNPENKEPRLLLVTVDIEEGETVTFDSYSPKSEYGEYFAQRKEYEYTITYDQGLMIEHVMASASVPLLYDFQMVPIEYDYEKAKLGLEQDLTSDNSRSFWDGALLSNTPTRELINHHKLFWENRSKPTNRKTVYQMRTEQDNHKREEYAEELFELLWKEMRAAATATPGRKEVQLKESKLKASDLDLYIVNLWPTEEKPFPHNDDYDLTRDLIQQLSKVDEKEVTRKILLNDSKTKSKFREGMPRKYLDLLIGRFDVNERFKLERSEDPKTAISNKWVDLSIQTIEQLIEQGKNDALKQIIDKGLII
jgi:NTE family protein